MGPYLFIHGGIYQLPNKNIIPTVKYTGFPSLLNDSWAFDTRTLEWIPQYPPLCNDINIDPNTTNCVATQSSLLFTVPDPIRAGHTMAYDNATATVVLYGGWTNPTTSIDTLALSDVWIGYINWESYNSTVRNNTVSPAMQGINDHILSWHWEKIGDSTSAKAMNTPWPVARRDAAYAYNPFTRSMFIYGGYYMDTLNIRVIHTDVWEWVFPPIPGDSIPYPSYIPNNYRGGWRKLGGIRVPDGVNTPFSRFGASGAFGSIPWYWYATHASSSSSNTDINNDESIPDKPNIPESNSFIPSELFSSSLRQLQSQQRQQQQNQKHKSINTTQSTYPRTYPQSHNRVTGGWGYLDFFIIAGGQIDGVQSFISTDPAYDNLWLLLLDEVSNIPLPPLANGFPPLLSPRNGTWMKVLFTEESYANQLARWGHSIAVAGADNIVLYNGLAPLDSSWMGSSVFRIHNDILTLSISGDLESQINSVNLHSMRQTTKPFGNTKNSELGYTPTSDGWRIVDVPSTSFIPVSSNEYSSSASYSPRYGIVAVTVNQSDYRQLTNIINHDQTKSSLSTHSLTYEHLTGPTNVIIYAGRGMRGFSEVWSINSFQLPNSRPLVSSDVLQDNLQLPDVLMMSEKFTIVIVVLSLLFVFMCIGLSEQWVIKIRNKILQLFYCFGIPLPGTYIDWEVVCGNSNICGRFWGLFCTLITFYCCGCRPEEAEEDIDLVWDSQTGEVRARTFRQRARLATMSRLNANSLRSLERQINRDVVNELKGTPEDILTHLPLVTYIGPNPNGNINNTGIPTNPLPTTGETNNTKSLTSGIRNLGTYFRRATAQTFTVTLDVSGPACPICLVDYDISDKLRRLPCAHYFHQPCIDRWLRQSSKLCPMCKHNVLEPFPLVSHGKHDNEKSDRNTSSQSIRSTNINDEIEDHIELTNLSSSTTLPPPPPPPLPPPPPPPPVPVLAPPPPPVVDDNPENI